MIKFLFFGRGGAGVVDGGKNERHLKWNSGMGVI